MPVRRRPLRLAGEPVVTFYCHCRMCQRAAGAPVVAWATVALPPSPGPAPSPATTGSSAKAERFFCVDCGTPLAAQTLAEPDLLDLAVGTLDDPADAPPDATTGSRAGCPGSTRRTTGHGTERRARRKGARSPFALRLPDRNGGGARVGTGRRYQAWLRRIGYDGPRAPTLATLCGVVAAHAAAIPYETVDPLLGHPPSLDVADLQRKIVEGGRGGYCFELNTLLRAGLRASVSRSPAYRRGSCATSRSTPKGPRCTWCCGSTCRKAPSSPTSASATWRRPRRWRWCSLAEQATPHEPMRFVPLGTSWSCRPGSATHGSTSTGWCRCRGWTRNTRSPTGSPPRTPPAPSPTT